MANVIGKPSIDGSADPGRRTRLVRWAVLVTAALLFFTRLGSTYLWQDEAQTALLGRQVLRHGLPLVGEGPASASALAGRDRGIGGLFLHIPPVQAYLAAAGMAFFGETALGARFLFALSGFACVCLLPWAMGRSQPSGAATAAQLVLGLHVPFLLFSRQARYYAPAALLLLIVIGCVTRLVPGHLAGRRRVAWELGLALGLALLDLTFEFAYLSAVGVVLVVLGCVAFRRGNGLGWGLRAIWPCIPSLLLFWGWLWLAQTAPSRRGGQGFNESAPDFPIYFLGQVNAYVVPLLVAMVLLLWWGVVRWRERRAGGVGWERDVFLCVSLLVAAVHLTVCTFTTHRFMRYIVPIVPVLVAVTVAALYYVTEPGIQPVSWRRWVRTVLMVLLVTGLWSGRDQSGRAWLPWERWLEQTTGCRWSRRSGVHLAAYVQELHRPPHGPVARVIDYLRANARPGAVVVAEYGEKPLKFHTACAVFGGETAELPPNAADWIWPRHIPAPWWELKRARDWIAEQLNDGGYQAVDFPGTVDSIWENRPDPEWHVFTEEQRRELFPDAPTIRLYRRLPAHGRLH